MEIVPPNFHNLQPVVPTQQAVTQALPQIQAQAAIPIVARAVDPTPKSERGQGTRSNRDRAKGGDGGASGHQRSGLAVDIKV